MIDKVFEGFDPDNFLWARNPDEDWHVLGPAMPRISPVSPTHVTPCASILYSDGLERPIRGPIHPDRVQGTLCAFCVRYVEQEGWRKRDFKRNKGLTP